MKYGLLFLFILLFDAVTHSQTNADSTSFEVQRQRVNKLLDERRQKFGEYDSSLTKKSGFFGLFKSKGDMEQTIEILKNIVLTDNNIFLETQKLLKIKDYEKENYQQLAKQYDQQVTAYIKTISKLQQENERLRGELEHSDSSGNTVTTILWIVVAAAVIILAGGYGYKKLTKR